MTTPGAGIGREIATGERAEADLELFISRRDTQRRKDEGERRKEEAWAASERVHNARRAAENRAAWLDFHRGQAERLRRNLAALVAHHEAAIVSLEVTEQTGDAA